MELHPALRLDYHALAALFVRSFQAYVVPIALDGAALEAKARAEAIDLSVSSLIELEGELAGLVLVSRRGRSVRVAAMGIAPEARGRGLGRRVLEQVIAGCRERGEPALTLEVIESNTPAVKLYRSMGFEVRRRLVGWMHPGPLPGAETAALEEVEPLDVARRMVIDGEPDLPWQLAPETIAQLTPPHLAFRLGEALAVVRADGPSIGLRSLIVPAEARGRGHATRLLRAICAAYPGRPLHIPPIVPERAAFFPSLGFEREAITQLEMRLSLGV
jgi:ribosomal protein S18 acetylase RimI-like enzyme